MGGQELAATRRCVRTWAQWVAPQRPMNAGRMPPQGRGNMPRADGSSASSTGHDGPAATTADAGHAGRLQLRPGRHGRWHGMAAWEWMDGMDVARPPRWATSPAAWAARSNYDNAQMPGYAWPSYASYPNYAAVTYPQQYSPTCLAVHRSVLSLSAGSARLAESLPRMGRRLVVPRLQRLRLRTTRRRIARVACGRATASPRFNVRKNCLPAAPAAN